MPSVVFSGGLLALVAVFLAAPDPAHASVVSPDGSGDYPTIQAALDAASQTDVIELTDGVFTGAGNKELDCRGKEVTIRSRYGHADACVIDCEGDGRAFYIHQGEGVGTVLQDFTIANGHSSGFYPDGDGGGVCCYRTSPQFVNIRFINNRAEHSGGGLRSLGGVLRLWRCVFIGNSAVTGGGVCGLESEWIATACLFDGNSASQDGGAIRQAGPGSPTLIGCTLIGNTASHDGGGLWLGGTTMPILVSCTLAGNCASHQGGGLYCYGPEIQITQTIIAFGGGGGAVACRQPCSITLSCTDIYGNSGGDWIGCIADQYGADGNISGDPLFCDYSQGDLTLFANSPCAPSAPPNPMCGLLGAWPVGCYPPVPAVQTTWGGIKARFRGP